MNEIIEVEDWDYVGQVSGSFSRKNEKTSLDDVKVLRKEIVKPSLRYWK